MDRHMAESLDRWLTTPPEEAWPDPRDDEIAGLVATAREWGGQAGKDASTWVELDEPGWRKLLAGIEAGDPAVLDAYATPNFSGEMAGDYSQDDLMNDLGLDDLDGLGEDELADLQTELADAYVEAARETFWRELEADARRQLAD